MKKHAIKKLTAGQTLPDDRAVFSRQGIPFDRTPNQRTVQLLEEAKQLYLRLAEPVAVTGLIDIPKFSEVYNGEALNHPDDPLAEIFPVGKHLNLFAATLGEKISSKIASLITEGDLAEGSMLDSVASEGADQVAEIIQNDWGKEVLAGRRSETEGVMRFSPGYCGWHISGQKKLFESLGPNKIGVNLNERFLMQPLKSVSGVIVIADKQAFRHSRGFEFCEECRDCSCAPRYREMNRRKF